MIVRVGRGGEGQAARQSVDDPGSFEEGVVEELHERAVPLELGNSGYGDEEEIAGHRIDADSFRVPDVAGNADPTQERKPVGVRIEPEVEKVRVTISTFICPVEQRMMILLMRSGASFYPQQKHLNLNSS